MDISLKVLFKYIKIRFLVICLSIIIFTPIISLWLPIYQDFTPEYSINSEKDYGSSTIYNSLQNYDVSQGYNATTSEYGSYDLIIINTPQNEIGSDIVDDLVDAFNQGTSILLIGSSNLRNVVNPFGVSYLSDPSGNERIFDDTNNGGDRVFPKLNFDNLDDVYGVVPTAIDFNFFPGPFVDRINTYSTSGFAYCWDRDPPCLASHTIGMITDSLSVIADEWMFKNEYVESFPQNIDLFLSIVNTLIGVSGSILFEESFLNWAPLNEKGVRNFIELQLDATLVLLLLSVFALVIPMIVSLQSDVFGNNPASKKKSSSYDTVEQRLSYIHIERLPAAPLNILERTLMDEKLRMMQRGKFYFQYLAHDLLDYIENLELNNKLPDNLILKLKQLKSGIYSEKSSWRLIEEIYTYLLSKDLNKNR